MKKIIIIFAILIINQFIFPEDVYNQFEYSRLTTEPVKWSPESGIFDSTINLTLTSDYGKIYYLVNSSLSEREPAEYSGKIILKELQGGIATYEVLALIEKQDGNLEFYSRSYRIDNTKKIEKNYSTAANTGVIKESKIVDSTIKLKLEFPSNYYNVSYNVREIDFPLIAVKNESNIKNIDLTKAKDNESLYLVNLTYQKDGVNYSEVLNYSFNKNITYPPSMGSLYWGQIYKHGYRIKIKPDNPEDKVYYWIYEWNKDDIIFGPPDQSRKEKWILYTDPVELVAKFGRDGITGIAAFSEGKDGSLSTVTGPYYFKINGVNDTLEQVFIEDQKDESIKKNIYVNDKLYEKDDIYYGSAAIRFENYSREDRYYFTFAGRDSSGKSELFPCTDKFNFRNTGINPVEINVYLANGNKIAGFTVYGEKMILPVIKKYNSNEIDLTGDAVIDFYMPLNQVRYGYTFDENNNIDLTGDSPLFTGTLKIATENQDKRNLKIKFRAFDKDNKAIADSNYYYFVIDKEKPSKDVAIEGTDIKIYHNDTQTIGLVAPEENLKVYYKLSVNDEWILYDKPLEFIPPHNGKFYVKIYVKSQNEAGNEKGKPGPFDLLFDTRGIFVDYKYKFNGNGTEESPCNSLEKAINVAYARNIRNIYIISDEINITEPLVIDSDIVIQPYKSGSKPKIHLNSKSLWKKNHIWVNIRNKGYLEIRNLDFLIESGGTFANTTGCKIKIYNSNFDFTGKDDFGFISNSGGKVGINNVDFNTNELSSNLFFLKTDNGINLLKNISMNLKNGKLNLFDINNTKFFELYNVKIDAEVNDYSQFADIKSSNVTFKNILFSQKGNYKSINFFNMIKSDLFIDQSDFVFNGVKPFEIKILSQIGSNSKIVQSLFQVKNAVSVIGINAFDSKVAFERSMMDVRNVIDYICDFRMENGSLKFNSSIIRSSDCFNAISFSLKNSGFEGANNSIFIVNNQGRGFDFWVTDNAKITTVNSLYFFNNKNSSSAFIYFNNNNYESLSPVWISNIISTSVVLLENLNKKDSDAVLFNFSENNINYNFDDEFDFSSNEFFIPVKDSPIFQAGITEYNSPIPIPKIDFKGNPRSVSGFGIDIGAVQKSGNF